MVTRRHDATCARTVRTVQRNAMHERSNGGSHSAAVMTNFPRLVHPVLHRCESLSFKHVFGQRGFCGLVAGLLPNGNRLRTRSSFRVVRSQTLRQPPIHQLTSFSNHRRLQGLLATGSLECRAPYDAGTPTATSYRGIAARSCSGSSRDHRR